MAKAQDVDACTLDATEPERWVYAPALLGAPGTGAGPATSVGSDPAGERPAATPARLPSRWRRGNTGGDARHRGRSSTDHRPRRTLGTMEAAFFDLDKTVIAKASMVAFGRPFQRAGLLSRWLVLRALYGQLVYLYLGADEARMAKMREAVLRVTTGWHQETIRELVRETLAEVIDPIVYEEALELIRDHRAAGRRVYIISASPEEIVEPLTEYLGADQAIATRARIDDQGRYSGDVEFYSYGPFKAEAMAAEAERLDIDLARSYAYSDSATDIPMLEAVGHPVAVNPDRALARYAAEQEWETTTFVRQVELKRRRPVPTTAAAVSGGVVMAAAGAAVWWWLHRQPPTTSRRSAGRPTGRPVTAAGAVRGLTGVVERWSARSSAARGTGVGTRRSRGSSSRRGPRGRRARR